LRRRLADERQVPPYIVFSDVALREMARRYPTSAGEFARVPGVGARKLTEFAAPFMAEITAFLAAHPRQTFPETAGLPEATGIANLNDTAAASLSLFQGGLAVADIARQRGLVPDTIYSHLASAVQAGVALDFDRLIPAELHARLAAAFAAVPPGSGLKAVKERLGESVHYGQLRLWQGACRVDRSENSPEGRRCSASACLGFGGTVSAAGSV